MVCWGYTREQVNIVSIIYHFQQEKKNVRWSEVARGSFGINNNRLLCCNRVSVGKNTAVVYTALDPVNTRKPLISTYQYEKLWSWVSVCEITVHHVRLSLRPGPTLTGQLLPRWCNSHAKQTLIYLFNHRQDRQRVLHNQEFCARMSSLSIENHESSEALFYEEL